MLFSFLVPALANLSALVARDILVPGAPADLNASLGARVEQRGDRVIESLSVKLPCPQLGVADGVDGGGVVREYDDVGNRGPLFKRPFRRRTPRRHVLIIANPRTIVDTFLLAHGSSSTHLDDLADLDSTLESLISSLSRLSTRQLVTLFPDVVQDVRAEVKHAARVMAAAQLPGILREPAKLPYITIFLKRMQPHVHVELSSSAHAWSILHEEHLAVIETMITSIATLSDTAATEKYLVQPMIVLHVLNAAPASSNEVLESLVSALRDLTTNGVPAHNPIRETLDNKVEDVQPFELPSFLVPPDVLDMDSLSDGVEAVVGDKKDDLPAYTIRTLITHITNIFKVNRKKAAWLLLELPKWLERRTFKSTKADAAKVKLLENTLIELSPTTLEPAVGRSIRNSFGDEPDVKIAAGSQNGVPDPALPVAHTRRAFVRRAIEMEIRMSYHDRIVKSLPEEFQKPEAESLPTKAPGTTFEYEDPSAQKAEQVISETETLRNHLQESGDAGAEKSVVRVITLRALVHVGSRSFSHLNAIERYLPVLRSLVTSARNARAAVRLVQRGADELPLRRSRRLVAREGDDVSGTS
ncbi:hypothetical protein EXIGLDRAFT_702733 [Exidia glandulosa HHB12029]|uniref:Symplekin/Pta1 N-terminal domain-containing protein n=1 Tax=Exidia glandulosa HHB12029 TaxID=1314781 RepID=A0A165CE58_EXIGL|nr:hypothetical protein EXIGLDRAFT_702733 [Exidia glandulosa HHB12029]